MCETNAILTLEIESKKELGRYLQWHLKLWNFVLRKKRKKNSEVTHPKQIVPYDSTFFGYVIDEELIKWGWPEDVWFHVDKMSSAHVYLRLQPVSSVLITTFYVILF